MAQVQHNCTGCVPIDASIIEVYTQLISTESRAEEAAERAEHAAEYAIGKSPYIGENGDWWEWDDEQGVFVDTGVQAQGQVAVDIEMSTTSTNPVQNRVITAAVNEKQDTLVSGTNIKTVNGESLLGEGNIIAGDPNAVKYVEQSLTDAQKAQARTNIAAYQKPASGIPATDLTSAAQTSLGKADSAYQKPGSGIPKADLDSSVQTSLGKADTAIQDISGKQDVISDLPTIRSGAAAGATAYQKPSSGIPKSDLSSGVQGSLDLADSAIQARPQGEITPVITPADYATREELGELEAKVTDFYGDYIVTPEWIRAITDNENKILCGIKPDGSIEWAKGIPAPIRGALEEKVNKIAGKSLIDSGVAESASVIQNEEYIQAITDKDDELIEAIKADGTKKFFVPLDIPGAKLDGKESTEWAYVIVDSDNKVLAGIKKNGETFVAKVPSSAIEDAGFLRGYGYEFVKNNEKAETLRRYLPLSVGSPYETLSYDNQYERVNILFFSDSHIDFNPGLSLQNVKDTVDFANNSNIQYDAVIHAGDVITPFNKPIKASAKKQIEQFFNEAKRSKYPFLFAKGNHDLNDWGNSAANTFDDSDWNEMWYNYAEEKFGIVRQLKSNGEKSTWNYYDVPMKKIRIITVDTQDADKETEDDSGHVIAYGTRGFYISNEQFQWLANTALDVPEGYGVICVMHQCYSTSNVWYSAYNGEDYEESSIEKFFDMCAAFNAHESFTLDTYTSAVNSFYNLAGFTKDFSQLHSGMTNKPSIICWLIGHEHFDRQETKNGINIIWILNNSASTISSDSRVARIAGTNTQNAFDLISIDTTHKKIRAVRYGAGKNCYGDGGDRFLANGLNY